MQNSFLKLHVGTLVALVLGTSLVEGREAPFVLPAQVSSTQGRIQAGGTAVGVTVLQGDAAKKRLKQTGQYNSLLTAIQSARYTARPLQNHPGTEESHGCYASNPKHSLRCWFRAEGVELQAARADAWRFKLRLLASGRAAVQELEPAEVTAHGNRVELSRAQGKLLEWYENNPAGLEQGFTILHRPAGTGPLRLVLETSGDLRPALAPQASRASAGGQAAEAAAAEFVNSRGEAILRYSGLKAWDAAHRSVPAHIEVHGRQLELAVNDRDVAYPLTIDPVITSVDINLESKLTGGGGAAGDFFGNSVSLNEDGNIALVGAYCHDTPDGLDAGSAYVLVLSGKDFHLQAELTPSDGSINDTFGTSVSLSVDGTTAIIGAPSKDTAAGADAGAAYILASDGGNWTQQARLTATDGEANDRFGISVSLSGDGNTALIGSDYHDEPGAPAAGSAYVFVRTGGNWSQQAQLTASDAAGFDYFGTSVSLSADGNTALVGALFQDTVSASDTGSAYVFVRSGLVWTQQAQLRAGDGASQDYFGYSVSLSGDGNTALVGALFHDAPTGPEAGSAYVFFRNGNSWGQQAQLTPADGDTNDHFGISVSLSADGNTALIGAYRDSSYTGSAYVFMRTSSSWAQASKLVDSDGGAFDYAGISVSLSADGERALVGAYGVNACSGEANLFERGGTNWIRRTELGAGHGAASDHFGCSVSLSLDGGRALIGADGDDTEYGVDAGSAYLFDRGENGWHETEYLRDVDGAPNDHFGCSVSLSSLGGLVLIGAYHKDVGANAAQGCVYTFSGDGGGWGRDATLTAADGLANDNFGFSISLSGDADTAVVGAYGADSARGSTYVFVRTNRHDWVQQAKLTASDGAASDRFGASVAVSQDGNRAVVGAYGDDSYSGSAYVYARHDTNWTQQAKLRAADGAANDRFGASAGISGDGNTALVGAYYDDIPAGGNAGSAYVFVRSGTNWAQQAQLTAADAAASDYFGSAVSLSWDGSTVLVGAYSDNTPAGVDAGSAYVFMRNGTNWSQQRQLTAPDGAASDYFGYSVSVSGDGKMALIGAYYSDTAAGTNAGSAYLFRLNSQLTADSGATNDLFGVAVALSGDGSTALVGAEGRDSPENAGCAYVFVRSDNRWDQGHILQLASTNRSAYDGFGTSVSLSWDGNTALVGAEWRDWPQANQGHAFVFVRDGGVWREQADLVASDGASLDKFGHCLSLSGDGNTALIGAYNGDIGLLTNAGSAYVFVRSGTIWCQQKKLSAADGASDGGFGISVSLSGDGNTALVGAWPVEAPGSAYVFGRSGSSWAQRAKLTPADGTVGDAFGQSACLSGDGNTALIGASPGDHSGRGYVFVRSGTTWTPQAKLTALDGAASDDFGHSVGLSWDGNTALLGAPGQGGGGSAYAFLRNGTNWAQHTVAMAYVRVANDRFGDSVSLSGDGRTAVIGAFLDDTPGGQNAGSAYIFQLSFPPLIIAQPTNQTVVAGRSASFFVNASGAEPLSYQWQHKGTNLPGATASSLTIVSVRDSDAGPYRVVVTNSAGSTTSEVSTLSVLPIQRAVLQAPKWTSKDQFQFTVTGTTGAVYVVQLSTNLASGLWFSIFTNPAPFTFSDPYATNSPQRFYRAIAP